MTKKKDSELSDTVYVQAHLPLPPSVNHYWLACKGSHKRRISPEGLAYRKVVETLANINSSINGYYIKHNQKIAFSQDIAVSGEVFLPDNRRRDLDNLFKCVFDSFTHAGIWVDDCQIFDLHFTKRRPVPEFPEGALFMAVCPFI